MRTLITATLTKNTVQRQTVLSDHYAMLMTECRISGCLEHRFRTYIDTVTTETAFGDTEINLRVAVFTIHNNILWTAR